MTRMLRERRLIMKLYVEGKRGWNPPQPRPSRRVNEN